jgi:hypothetical protein
LDRARENEIAGTSPAMTTKKMDARAKPRHDGVFYSECFGSGN